MDTDGVVHTSNDIDARRFDSGNNIAIVLTQSHLSSAETTLQIPAGYEYADFGAVGNANTKINKESIQLVIKKHGLAVVIFKKL
jgi:hypothetical protein